MKSKLVGELTRLIDVWDGHVLPDDITALEVIRAGIQKLEESVALLTHKLVTCGVAANHPNAVLTEFGAYKEKWDSPQVQAVRDLRHERDRLLEDRVVLDACPKCGHRWVRRR